MAANSIAAGTLRAAGVASGMRLLDFGCGLGDYAIPAAGIVGEKGVVYAVDKDAECLRILNERASAAGVTNLKVVETSGAAELPLADGSVDHVLLYDVIHSDYFSASQRMTLLAELKRVSGCGAVVSVYPKHMNPEDAIVAMVEAGFVLNRKLPVELLHDHSPEKGCLLNFTVSL